MQRDLIPHPAAGAAIIASLRVRASRESRARLMLEYEVEEGAVPLFVPPLTAPVRADGLWTTTCFEAFLKRPGEDAYVELNISPSGRWASYAFDGYRQGMRVAHGIVMERFDLQAADRMIRVSAAFDLSDPMLDGADDLLAGFSAVIEGSERSVSHWALVHPAEAPDFHAGDCFAAALRAPAQP